MNYQREMEKILKELEEEKKVPTLLLHTCCAPCSSYTIEKLSQYFKITVFYYNPNIEPKEEYEKRKIEQIRFLKEYPAKNEIHFLDCDYDHESFLEIAKGLEQEKEGGARCKKCFSLRLTKTAQMAKEHHFDYFGTSLTVSPYKNANWVNEIGLSLQEKYKVSFLVSDLKKQDGYKKSIELSKMYHLYRQNYCGCSFSQKERIYSS